MTSTEKETQKACLELLESKRIFHYRQNTGAFKGANGGFYRFGVKGGSDVVAVIDGIYIAIEIKDEKAGQDPDQALFQRALENAGGKYLLVKNIDDLISFLEKYYASKRKGL